MSWYYIIKKLKVKRKNYIIRKLVKFYPGSLTPIGTNPFEELSIVRARRIARKAPHRIPNNDRDENSPDAGI